MEIIKKLSEKINAFDADLTGLIQQHLSNYNPGGEIPYFTSLLPNLIKTIAYALPFLIIFAFLKFLYPYNSLLTFVLVIMLVIITISAFGIFLGFLQILY